MSLWTYIKLRIKDEWALFRHELDSKEPVPPQHPPIDLGIERGAFAYTALAVGMIVGAVFAFVVAILGVTALAKIINWALFL